MFDMVALLKRKHAFSLKTFGPGLRTAGVLDHIRKELAEIEKDPLDIYEWVDVIALAIDGAMRHGATAEGLCDAIAIKQRIVESRTYPDWRTADPTKGIEHVRSE